MDCEVSVRLLHIRALSAPTPLCCPSATPAKGACAAVAKRNRLYCYLTRLTAQDRHVQGGARPDLVLEDTSKDYVKVKVWTPASGAAKVSQSRRALAPPHEASFGIGHRSRQCNQLNYHKCCGYCIHPLASV